MSNEQCPRCGVPWTLGRDVGGRVHTPGGMDCLRRQLAQVQERAEAAEQRARVLETAVDMAEEGRRYEHETLLMDNHRLRREKEISKSAARYFEEALDNVREALGIEETEPLVIHDQVREVVEERDRLRQERETLAEAVRDARDTIELIYRSSGYSDVPELTLEKIARALALLDGEKGGGEA